MSWDVIVDAGPAEVLLPWAAVATSSSAFVVPPVASAAWPEKGIFRVPSVCQVSSPPSQQLAFKGGSVMSAALS